MEVDLTREDHSQKINITKGTTQANLDDAIAAAREARDAAETHKDSALNSASSASNSASTATGQATIATTKASEASSSATSASASATIATTKASEASTSATNALASETNASTSETNSATYMNNALNYATDASLSETNAAGSATSASASATSASTSATSASSSATTATTQAGIATTKAGEASTSAANAATSETNAGVSAATATTKAAEADASAQSASASATLTAGHLASIETIYDNFDDRYLGDFASDPTLDNDGNALQIGAMYFNTTVNNTKFYNGTAWEDPEATATQAAATATTKASEASVSVTNAATSEANAATSEANASTSATNAAASASAAATSAANALASENAAELAETNAESAETSAVAANTSALAAQSAAQSAQTSAETAQTAAEAAQTSATASANSATASATSAGLSATNAASSETDAETAATAAASSATAASSSATSASTSATTATTQAGTATTKATEASTSATNAATSETNASVSATSAATSETNAATSEINASTSATNAANSATSAATSASDASTKLTQIETIYDNFDDRFLGAKATDPTVDNDGDALQVGATYWNTADDEQRFYNGTIWERPSYIATQAASQAQTSATNAATSESNASTSASNANTSATNASASATAAATSEANALTYKGAAEAARDSALAALDSFDDRYLGQKAVDPTVDNDGDPLVAGSLYFNTTTDEMKVYEGSAWVAAYASLSGALLANNNLSDLTDIVAARTNLGLGTAATTSSTAYEPADATILKDADIGSTVQGYDANIVSDASYVHTDNNYTTTEKSKLAGIESGATGDQTASEILTLVKTVDGSGSGLDADTVDGKHISDIFSKSLETNTGGSWPDSTTGTYQKGLTIVGGNQRLNIDVSNSTNGGSYIQTRHKSDSYPTAEYVLALNPQGGGVTINGNTAWHAGNDGSGSGLDADKLDGLHSTAFLRSLGLIGDTNVAPGSTTNWPNNPAGGTYTTDYVGHGGTVLMSHDVGGSAASIALEMAYNGQAFLHSNTDSNQWLTYKLWTSSNDGAGSGLDADTLDGVQASSFLRSDADDTATGSIRFTNANNYFGSTGSNTAEIWMQTGNAGSPQIAFTDNQGDMSWAIGGDDADNSFKIHGSASGTIPTINSLATPYFEITTSGTTIINGTCNATSFIGDGSQLTGIDAGGETKAWVRFRGNSTVAIYDSHNVSSVTDLGTGRYRVNFASAMANGNYAVCGNHGWGGACDSTQQTVSIYSTTTTSIEIRNHDNWNGCGSVYRDNPNFHIQVTGA